MDLPESPETKRCNDCRKVKPVTKFSWRHKSKGTRQGRCKDCMSIRMRSGRYELGVKYKMTSADYETMLEKQHGKCAICREPESVQWRDGTRIRLAVDHDRSCCPGRFTCGKCVRALLCANCNRLVGRLESNPARVNAAIRYIKSYKI